jgi:hypothetical protein
MRTRTKQDIEIRVSTWLAFEGAVGDALEKQELAYVVPHEGVEDPIAIEVT